MTVHLQIVFDLAKKPVMMAIDLKRYNREWFSEKVGQEVIDVLLSDPPFEGGGGSELKKVKLTLASGGTLNLVLKFMQVGASYVDTKSIVTWGFAREADFYNLFAESNHFLPLLPKIYFATSDWKTGAKEIIMEDLSESGTVARGTSGVCPLMIAGEAFKTVARFHAYFWGTKEFLDCSWARGNKWVLGEGREDWESLVNGRKAGKFNKYVSNRIQI